MTQGGWPERALRSALALSLALVLVTGIACDLVDDGVDIQGTVVDASTGDVVPGAAVVVMVGGAADRQAIAQADGTFKFERVKTTSSISTKAEGYQPKTVDKLADGELKIELEPVVVDVAVVDAGTGQPISSASLTSENVVVENAGPGTFRIVRARPGATVKAVAEDYAPGEMTYTDGITLTVKLRPNTLSGKVTDADSGDPIEGARVSVGQATASTGPDGSYKLADLPTGSLEARISASGYESATEDVSGKTQMDFSLRPFVVRAPYVTFYAVGEPGLMDPVIKLVDDTELNAVVIDIKGDRGWIAYHSEVPLAEQIGANEVHTIDDVDALMAELKSKGIYSIARIVVFKDDPLARNGASVGLDVAVKDGVTGGLWIDGEDLGWVDPFRQETWDYNIELAKEAAQKGFDEIQFDYIRFPTDPSAGTSVDRTVFSQPNTEANRLEAVAGFLERAQAELKPLGVNISVDVFGYTCWRDDDMGIGQKIEVIGKYADFICPMVYPSTYSDGIPDYKDAVGHPYEIVYYSVKRAVERLQGMPVKVRPWLQYFDDYPWASGRAYNEAEILTQKKASDDAGGCGWQLWDPFVKYARGGIAGD